MSLVLIFGTRPEAIKLGPVAAELRAFGVEPTILCTGQHTDLLRGTPAETDLVTARSLGMPSDGNVPRYLTFATHALRNALDAIPDAFVVVQGDTSTALAGAQAAASLRRPLAHVEAGVRSHDPDEPWPEEVSRVRITSLADWHYAPTATAYANLIAEGVPQSRIRLTGNTVVSALARYTSAKPTKPPEPWIVVTMHRHEWLARSDFPRFIEALPRVARAYPRYRFLWPMHPNVRKRISEGWFVGLPENLQIIGSLPYREMASLVALATGVVTDSGGLSEEAATLGTPCAIARRVTDRSEALSQGVIFQAIPDDVGLALAVETLTSGVMARRPTDTFGTPESASLVARHLAQLASA